jgi:mRNA (guanine-N7-)-methyltransferase
MCCGKGGDIQKWSKSNAVRHVVFADIAETSVEQCKERYKTMASYQKQNVFSAEFISADCTKVIFLHSKQYSVNE